MLRLGHFVLKKCRLITYHILIAKKYNFKYKIFKLMILQIFQILRIHLNNLNKLVVNK